MVQPFDPDGTLEAAFPLMMFVFGTAQVPPPFNRTSFALQVAVAVWVVLVVVTVRMAAEIPAGPWGPAGPVGP